jgi:carbonic anhydrase
MFPHRSPIAERIDWLFGLAQRHAQEYASPEAWLARQRHLANHPTAIVVMKCMDGRINIPIATQTPKGIIQPFRNLGGIFNLKTAVERAPSAGDAHEHREIWPRRRSPHG